MTKDTKSKGKEEKTKKLKKILSLQKKTP